MRLKPTVEQIVMSKCDVTEPLSLDERAGRVRQLGVNVRARDRAAGADPLTQDTKPPEAATTDVERLKVLAAPETIQQRTPGWLPHRAIAVGGAPVPASDRPGDRRSWRLTWFVLLPTVRQPT
jgi:hypothetical protein